MALEDKKMWLQFFQFIIGTVILSLVTLYVNSTYQDRQLEQAREKQNKELELAEMEMLGNFLERAVDSSPGDRMKFAEYFATMTTSDTLRNKWVFYRDSVVGREIDNIKEKIKILEVRLAEVSTQQDEALQIHKKIEELTSQIRGNLHYTEFFDSELSLIKENTNDISKIKRIQEKSKIPILLGEGRYEEVLQLNPSNQRAHFELFKNQIKNPKGFNKVQILRHFEASGSELSQSDLDDEYVKVAELYDSHGQPNMAIQVLSRVSTICEQKQDLMYCNRVIGRMKDGIKHDFYKSEEVKEVVAQYIQELETLAHKLRFG